MLSLTRDGHFLHAKRWLAPAFTHGEFPKASVDTHLAQPPYPRYLVVTSDELLELKVHDEKRFLVAVDNVHSLENIIKITFKKKTPKLLTFSYCSENSSSGTVNNPSQPPPAPAEDEGKGKLNEEGEGGPNQPTDDTKKHHSMRRYVVERPTECISTVTRAVDAFVKRNLAV